MAKRIRRPAATDPIEWFLTWFDTSGGPDSCHEWQRSRNKRGYGVTGKGFQKDFGTTSTHVIKWILENGPVPDGRIVRHIVCDNPPCGNVAHMALGTDQDNSDDKLAKGRQARGDRHGRTQLTGPQVLGILLRLEGGEPQVNIAARYGVRPGVIRAIKAGRSWSHYSL